MKMLTLLGIFMFSFAAHAISGRTTYQAKIVKPDGYPLEASSVNFRFTILDPAASCVLYIEDYAAVNMTGTGGLISFALGAGTRSYPVSSTTLASVFDNATVSFPCQSPGIYNPTSVDNRKIVMQFQDSSGWQTLPAMAINAVPYAMYAGKSENAIQLNGKSDTAFVENATLAALNCNVTTHAITFNGVSFSCIPVGSGSSGITSVTTSGTVLSTGGTASAPVISITAATMSSDGYLTSLDYAEFKAKLSASSTQIVNTLGYAPVSGAAVATQINNSNLSGDVSGTISSNSVVSVGGKTATQVSTSVDDTLAATSSATADTIVKRNSSGNFTANDIYANAAKINYVDIYKPSTSFNIRLQAPTSLSTNYILNLPTTSGTTGQVLSTDGSGNLSWINPSTGSVVSVSATAPLASTGGSNPTISITQSSSSTDGYLSSTDWNTFNNKQAATSAAIIATLGYTPADNAASGTYAQKANNLSDLTNVATARVNLGLGTFATASSIDLGSASATGIIAEARLQTQTNVTSGTQYTKVTVDGKGRVTSGAQLSSSDVTSALGYTPSNAASAGITTLNGSSSATQTFAIGTSGNSPAFNTAAGTHTLNIPLANTGSVTAGLLSNTDYTTFNNKQTATSAAIIATLGYTPADNAASGTYLVKASDLSDLTNVATARSNLGLGTFATASSVDLGSASATGTLAIARLPSFSGDATIAAASNTIVLSNSGVTAGTYTKLTVDAKGRVTSSAALASSDVTTALGYTPANSASGITSLNGSVSQTQTFATANTGTAFGIATSNGVHTISIPLAASSSVVGGLLSNVDYATFTNKQNATSAAIIATLGYTPANATSATQWTTNGSNIYYNTGNIGVGIFNPTAKLELASGTASVAPLKFTSGTLLSSAQSGTMEYDGFNYYLTDSTNTRRTIATGSSAGSIDNASIINSTGNISMVPVGSVIVSSTTASTNSNTGALVVKGGLGVAGNINTAGNLNVSGSSVIDGSLKLSAMTSGSMLFAGANGTVTQDNSNLYWDEANKRLGIGSNSPAQTLSVSGTSYFSGNVGVGTSTPTTKFQVNDGSGRNFRVASDVGTSNVSGIALLASNDADSAYMPMTFSGSKFIFHNGSVGVGTSNPLAALDVRNTASGSNTVFHAFSPNLASGTYTQMRLGMTNSAFNSAELRYHNVGGSGSTANYGALALYSQATPSIVFNGSGNVGIGTNAPQRRLVVREDSGSTNTALYNAQTTGASIVFSMRSDTTGVGASAFQEAGGVATRVTDHNHATYSGDLEFFNAGAGAVSTKMIIKGSGNVGVGTTTPSANFSVSGATSLVGLGNYANGLLYIGSTSSNAKGTLARLGAYTFANMDAPGAHYFNWGARYDGESGQWVRAYTAGANYLPFLKLGTNSKFSIGGAASSSTADSNPTWNDYLTVDTANGNVGIGTTSPTYQLDVSGSIRGTQIYGNLQNQALYSGGALLHGVNASGTPETDIASPSYRALPNGVNGGVYSWWNYADSVGEPTDTGQHGAGIGFGRGAGGSVEIWGGWTGEGFLYTRFLRDCCQGWSGWKKILIENSAGNVGIGTNAPSANLDVVESQNGDTTVNIRNVNTGTSARSGFTLTNSGTAYGSDSAGMLLMGTGHSSGEKLQLFSNSAIASGIEIVASASTAPVVFSTQATERMRITNTGNVGIGTTTPANTLDVSGTLSALKITGTLMSIDNRAVSDTPETASSAGMLLNFKNNSTNGLNDGGTYNGVITFRPYGNITDWTGGPSHQIGFTTNGNLFHRYGSNTTWNTWRRIIETDASGRVGIGTTAPSYTLDVSGTLRVKGTAYTDGGYTTWTAASDIRLKDIHGNYNRGLDDILGLDIIRFQYKSDNPVGLDSSKEFVGVTAQNLQQGIPEAVTEETNGKLKGYLTINTTPVLWTLVNAVKQLYKQVMERFEGQDRQIASIVESKADKAETDAKIKMLETKAAEVDSLKVENAAKAKEIDALKSYLCSKDPTAPICK